MSSLASQRNLWTLRLYYFLLIGGGGFLFPFINLFYTQQGLSGTEIGLLSTFASLAALIAAPWWGRRSDATSHPRRLLQFGLLATSVVHAGLEPANGLRLDGADRHARCLAQRERGAVIRCGGVGRDETGPRGVWQRAPVGIARLGGGGFAGRLADRADRLVHDVRRLCDQRLRKHRAVGAAADAALGPATRSGGGACGGAFLARDVCGSSGAIALCWV